MTQQAVASYLFTHLGVWILRQHLFYRPFGNI